jgi:hypothetical protein
MGTDPAYHRLCTTARAAGAHVELSASRTLQTDPEQADWQWRELTMLAVVARRTDGFVLTTGLDRGLAHAATQLTRQLLKAGWPTGGKA